MRRLLLAATFLLAASVSAQPRPPLTRALADALYAKLAGGSTIAGTTTFANIIVSSTCTGCSSGTVPTTRLVSTTAPLGGGGDLSADRTLTCTTCATSSNNLSFFSATSSAQLLALLNDETGSGLAVFATSPTIITPTVASFTNATHNHQNAAGGGTLVDAAIVFTAPALGAPTATTVQTSGNVGIGVAPNAVSGRRLDVLQTGNQSTKLQVSNLDAADNAALALVGAAADVSLAQISAFGTGHTASLFGVTIGGWSSLNNGALGNGLLIGTTNFSPVRMGTNGTLSMLLDTSQRVGIGVTPTANLHLKAGTASANTGPLKIDSGTLLTTTEAGAIENDGTHLYYSAANSGTRFQLDQQSAGSGPTVTVTSAQFDKTDTTLANVTGLSVNITNGTTYAFRAALTVTCDAVGTAQVAIGGTSTGTIWYLAMALNGATVRSSKTTTQGTGLGLATQSNYISIEGSITATATGTLTVQFAQNTSNGTSSVLVGSSFTVTPKT